MVDVSEGPIILHDTQTIVDVNDAACKLFGLERQDLIDKKLVDGVADAGMKQIMALRLKTIREIGEMHEQDFPFMRGDGTIFWATVKTTIAGDGLYKTTIKYLYEY